MTAHVLDGAIAEHTLGLAELGRRHPPGIPVPTCGDWNLADLVRHLAEVQDFWCHVIGGRPDAGPSTYTRAERPTDDALPDFLASRCHRLVEVLESADDRDRAWSWSDDHTVGFTRRRQTHEALIHHVDGLLAVRAPMPAIAPQLAADGVDELIDVMLVGIPDWADHEPSDATIRLVTDDTGDRWDLALGRLTGTSPDTGRRYDVTAFEPHADLVAPTTTIAAPAAALDLWMWGRAADDAVSIAGDPAGAHRLRTAIIECTR